jgi:hypothetical protein
MYSVSLYLDPVALYWACMFKRVRRWSWSLAAASGPVGASLSPKRGLVLHVVELAAARHLMNCLIPEPEGHLQRDYLFRFSAPNSIQNRGWRGTGVTCNRRPFSLPRPTGRRRPVRSVRIRFGFHAFLTILFLLPPLPLSSTLTCLPGFFLFISVDKPACFTATTTDSDFSKLQNERTRQRGADRL